MPQRYCKRRAVANSIGVVAVGVIACAFVAGWHAYARSESNEQLISAIKSGDHEQAIKLLNSGADANSTDQPGRSIRGRLAELLRMGSSVGESDHSKPTALMLVFAPERAQSNVFREPVELVRALVSKGANVNAMADTDSWYRSPVVIHAAAAGDIECVRLLLDNGALPNCRNVAGGTPLMYAGNSVTARLLIARGADVNARTYDGASVLQIAASGPDAESRIHLLKAAGARK